MAVSRFGREINHTEKGRLYNLGCHQENWCETQQKLYQQLRLVKELIESEDSVTADVVKECGKLQTLYQEFMRWHAKCQLLLSSDERSIDERIGEEVDNKFTSLKNQYATWLTSRSMNEENKSVSPKSSVRVPKAVSFKSSVRASRASSKSSSKSSHLSSKIAEEKAKIAELQVQASYQNRIEEKKRELEAMKSEAEIAKSQAKLQVYEEEFNSTCGQSQNADAVLESLPKSSGRDNVRDFVIKSILPHNDGLFKEKFEPIEISQTFKSKLDRNPESSEPFNSTFNKLSESVKRNLDILNHKPVKTENYEPSRVRSSDVPNLSSYSKLCNPPCLPEPDFNSKENMKSSAVNNNVILSMFKELQAPNVELDVFSGNAMDFPFFMTNFCQVVEDKIEDEKGRLSRLIQFTDGRAKDLVKSCIYLPDDICYKRAKKLLQEKYGDPFIVNSEYRKMLVSLSRIRPNDISSFNEFENFLIKFRSSMEAIGQVENRSPELLQLVQSKLPSHLQDRWTRKVYHMRKQVHREASLDNFIDFLREEIEILCDPLFSRDAIIELSKRQGRDRDQLKCNSKYKSFGVSAKEECICCNKKWHDLEKCYIFKKMSPKEKKAFVLKKRLCFKCFDPITPSHIGKSCKKPRKCTICEEDHPTVFHPTTEESPSVMFVNHESSIGLSVVMVEISHKENPEQKVKTLAFLDSGSQGSFVSEDLLEGLRIKGSKTRLEIQTMNGRSCQPCRVVTGLQVTSLTKEQVELPKMFSQPFIPINKEEIPTLSKIKKWKHLERVHEHIIPDDCYGLSVGLLIGANCPKALEPHAIISSKDNGPFAVKTALGWCVSGPMRANPKPYQVQCYLSNINSSANPHFTFKNTIKDLSLKDAMLRMYELDFHESSRKQGLSVEDERFLEIMKSCRQVNGKYCMPLPLRSPDKNVPNNRQQVVQRSTWLKRRLTKNPQMLKDYKTFIDNILSKGYARAAVDEPKPHRTWYIPHHGVYQPQKPDKIRVVFDCSVEYKNYCLNKELLQGPDLTNHLIGVLLRFRQNQVAVMADVESMFYRVDVPEEFQDYLRFLWWPDGDLSRELTDYQLCVHLIGATSSPSCANYALRQAAKDYAGQFGDEAASVLVNNFYVDDMLKSFIDNPEAVRIIPNVISMTESGGFHLTKFHSNSREVLSIIPEGEKSKSLKNMDLSTNPIPDERVLGMHWCPESDKFGYRIKLKEKPLTRRGVLSTISSIYDPLGIAGPYLLEGKKILQQICIEKGWDDPLSDDQVRSWERWKSQISLLENIEFHRCFFPQTFGNIVDISIHHFSDASCDSYGQVSYIRIVDEIGQVSCRIIIAKTRVAPAKRPTVPRLELTAAVLSVKVAVSLREELGIPINSEFFWTDSQVVLAYILNESKRFHMFVSNRVKLIRANTKVDQWFYVPSKDNPADDASRGLTLSCGSRNERWLAGPSFLYNSRDQWPKQPSSLSVSNEDKEVKKLKSHAVVVNANYCIESLEKSTSKWYRMKRIVATMLSWRLKSSINVELLRKAEYAIIRMVQLRAFREEIKLLGDSNRSHRQLKKKSSLIKLSPFIDQFGILRVGGRIQNADVPYEIKHPIILPRRCPTTNLVIQHAHEELFHAGRTATLNELRSRGYWIVNGNSLVRFYISRCVKNA